MRFAGMKIASQRYLKDLCKVCLIERGNDDALPVFYCWRNLVVGRVDSVMEVHVGHSAPRSFEAQSLVVVRLLFHFVLWSDVVMSSSQ